jgi:PKD repeat protein
VTQACVPPAITVQPASQTIASGQAATLTVSATGTAPLSYQWYRGSSPDTSNPVGNNANSFTTPPLTATTSYWVRVSNGCGHSDSTTATVTVSTGCLLSCTATVPSAGTAGEPVSFAATATPSGCTGTPAFAWTFGDGQGSTAQNPQHTYSAAGSYLWGLTVSLQGALCSKSGTINISTGGGGTVTLYESGFESGSGLAGWETGYFQGGNSTAADWRGVMTCPAHGGSKVFRFGGPDCTAHYADQDNCFASPGGAAGLFFPSGASQARLSFWHRWEFESGYDGAMLRISLDHQTYYYIPGSAPGVWIEGGYNGTVPYGSGTREMWTGTSTGFPSSFVRTQVDLDAAVNYILSTTTGVAGKTLWIAFGGFSDSSINKEGWCLDDVAVTYQGSGSCTLACTATAPSSGTAGTPVSFVSTAAPSGCTGTPAFAWAFGDGQTSTAQNPSHTYAAAGAYGWSLTVSVQGVTCTRSGTIAISGGGSNNDLCADAILITGETFSRTFSTAGFGLESGEPTPLCQSRYGATAWLRFTPAATGRVTLATCGSDFDTVLALYSGGCGAWTPVACNDDGCGLQSQISSVVVNPGTAYLVQVSGYQGATGTVTFSFSFTPGLPPPPVVTAMAKMSPFGIKVVGSNLQNGIRVFINGTEWTNVQWKSTSKVKILGGGALKAAVPKGVQTQFRFLNPDGGEATTAWGW